MEKNKRTSHPGDHLPVPAFFFEPRAREEEAGFLRELALRAAVFAGDRPRVPLFVLPVFRRDFLLEDDPVFSLMDIGLPVPAPEPNDIYRRFPMARKIWYPFKIS